MNYGYEDFGYVVLSMEYERVMRKNKRKDKYITKQLTLKDVIKK